MAIAAVRTEPAMPEDIEELFREHYQLLYRSAFGVTGNRQDAEDVLQSLFVKLLQNGIPPELRQRPARYLHRAVVNLALNVLRSRRRQRLVDGVEDLTIPAFDGRDADRQYAEFHDRLTRALAQLKPRALEILLLHYKHVNTQPGPVVVQDEERMSPVVAFTVTNEPLSEELATLFREHARLVYRTAYYVTRSTEDAEDVAQGVFLHLMRRGVPAGLRNNPKGYLYRAAVNLALTAVKSRQRRALAEQAQTQWFDASARPASSTTDLQQRLARST